jgi:hypothetical protein
MQYAELIPDYPGVYIPGLVFNGKKFQVIIKSLFKA